MILRNLFKKQENFCIKDGYQSNLFPSYFYDESNDFIYQPYIYELAYYLAKRCKPKYIIDIGSGNGLKLQKFQDEYKIICIDYGENLNLINENIKLHEFIEANLEQGLPHIKEEIIKNSIIIMSDVIEHIIDPGKLLKDLSEISFLCEFMLISTPERIRARGIGDFGPPVNLCHVREWSIDEFDALLRKFSFKEFMMGYTINTDFHLKKSNIVVLTGRNIYSKINDKVTVLAVLNVFNEADIIEDVVYHILNQGLDVKVVDNWSNDGTYEKIEQIMKKNKNRVFLQKFPESEPKYYEWEKLLKNTEKIALETRYDWIIHYDADEFRESPWKDVTLVDAISFVDFMGFNAIDFTVLDFRPTEETMYNYGELVTNKIRNFEFGKKSGHFIQIKGWKNIKNTKVDLASTGGHEAIFDNRKVYPIKFITKHYPLRNKEQSYKKIFKERISRFSSVEKNEKGWHTQYDNYKEDDNFIWERESLISWDRTTFDIEYFIERISGIGIV